MRTENVKSADKKPEVYTDDKGRKRVRMVSVDREIVKTNEKAVSKAQQKFFGIVRGLQKGKIKNASPDAKKAAASMSKKDVKDFAATKHKGLPAKKETTDAEVKKKQDFLDRLRGKPPVKPVKEATMADRAGPGKGKDMRDMSKLDHAKARDWHQYRVKSKGDYHSKMAKIHHANAIGGSSMLHKESLQKDIATLSGKYPERSKVKTKDGKTGTVVSVGRDYVKVAHGNRMKDYHPSKLEACWTGYKQVGMKKKGDKMVPNCVPESFKSFIGEAIKLTPAQIKRRDAKKAARDADGRSSAARKARKANPPAPKPKPAPKKQTARKDTYDKADLHPIMQLRKVVDNPKHVPTFHMGKSGKVNPKDAADAIRFYERLPVMGKRQLQIRIAKGGPSAVKQAADAYRGMKK